MPGTHQETKAEILKNPVILALDVDSIEDAVDRAQAVGDLIGAIKIGPRLCLRYGKELVQKLGQIAPIFMDNKHFDITSTMLASVRTSFELGASLVTVHALAGSQALKALSELEIELSQIRPFRIVAVTILTSWEKTSLPAVMKPEEPTSLVRSLAEMVSSCGLNWIVCSAQDLPALSDLNLQCITPGVRLSTERNWEQEDQKRIATPSEAMALGAKALVIGRPILSAEQPRKVLTEILHSLYQ